MAPVWCLLMLVLVNYFFAWLDLQTIRYELSLSPHFKEQSYSDIVSRVVWRDTYHAIFLGGQALVYWFIRKRRLPKSFAWLHVGVLSVAYFLLQAAMYWFTQMRLMGQIESDTIQMLWKANSWLYWIVVAVAEVFFILLLVKVFMANKRDPDAPSAPVFANTPNYQSTNMETSGVQRGFLAPVWILGILLLIVTYMLETTLIFWYEIGHEERYQGISPSLLLPDVFRLLTMDVLLLAECFFYYHFRLHMQQKWQAWTHVGLLLVGWILFPAVLYLSRPEMSRNTGEMILALVKWGCTLVAHVFFFIALNKASKNHKKASPHRLAVIK